MKITLIHCYSDHNRGDTGIIYSIHDLIKGIAPSSDIRAMSVFSEKDSRLLTDHKHTSKVINTVYPAFFPEPGICLNETSIPKNKTKGKIATFIKYACINTIIYITKSKTLAKKMFSEEEYSSFENFISSDIVISKGGSFLYSFKGWNGALFFFRMISPFYLAKRFGVKTYIYSQSLGPFENKSSKLLFKAIQNSINKIYLREENCLRYLEKTGNNIKIISDSAFALNAHTTNLKPQTCPLKKVAITARPHNFADKQQESIYIEAFSNLINTLTTENYQIYLVAQVTGPSASEDDRKSLDILYDRTTQKDKITYIRENLNPRELKALYGEMDFLIGTRLHSVIFALGMGVPCINIAYHGTKAQGIMGRLGLDKYVLNIESMTSQSLILSFRDLESNATQYKSLISKGLVQIKTELETSMAEILKP